MSLMTCVICASSSRAPVINVVSWGIPKQRYVPCKRGMLLLLHLDQQPFAQNVCVCICNPRLSSDKPNNKSRKMGHAHSKSSPAGASITPSNESPPSSAGSSATYTYNTRDSNASSLRSTSSTSTASFHTTTSFTSLAGRGVASTTSTLAPINTNLTHSMRPRELHHLSYLIDPNELDSGWKVRSPSGNLLGKQGYFTRDDRPLSLRERQERIRAGLASPGLSPVVQEGADPAGLSDGASVKGMDREAFRGVLREKQINVRTMELELERKRKSKKRTGSLLCY